MSFEVVPTAPTRADGGGPVPARPGSTHPRSPGASCGERSKRSPAPRPDPRPPNVKVRLKVGVGAKPTLSTEKDRQASKEPTHGTTSPVSSRVPTEQPAEGPEPRRQDGGSSPRGPSCWDGLPVETRVANQGDPKESGEKEDPPTRLKVFFRADYDRHDLE